jgi:G:T-mismatch repair DNA endonuclease (very short patch repair protein)
VIKGKMMRHQYATFGALCKVNGHKFLFLPWLKSEAFTSDKANAAVLKIQGWQALTVWECEISVTRSGGKADCIPGATRICLRMPE